MAVRPHLRVTALGRFGTSVEKFSYGVNLTRSNGGLLELTQTLLEIEPSDDVFTDLAEDVRAFHSRVESRISERCILETVKIAKIGEDGKYLADPVIVNVPDTPGGQIPGGAAVPPQSALVISLTTAQRGPGGKGRFYMPMPAVNVEPDMLIAQATVETIRGSAQTFLNALANQPGIDILGLAPAVISSKGTSAVVTGVRVGRVVDTMRSRRRSLQEEYTAIAPVG